MKNVVQTIEADIAAALLEDIGDGDITAQLIAPNTRLNMHLLCREQAVLCGREWFNQAFHQLDKAIEIGWLAADGDALDIDQTVCRLAGPARALLSAERTALNFLQTLSGTATTTAHYQKLIAHTGCKLLDTRKTIPHLRQAQKYAVRCGGGINHRMGLYDAFLLKENHLAACGGISVAVQQARKIKPEVLLEVEVENLQQLQEAIDCHVDRVLLDNFSLTMLQQAVELNQRQIQLEASGDITQHNIAEVAESGVDYISIGALTKHVRAIDFSLRFDA